MKTHETKTQPIDLSGVALTGRVLDVGGGGEGIISRLGGDKVTAIDNSADELAETPDIGIKIIMDARRLNFLNDYFDAVTCFYTLMYMDLPHIKKFLAEARRVLKPNGSLLIWDAAIPASITSDIFVARLAVKLSEELTITVGYGAARRGERSANIIRGLCENEGFVFQSGCEDGESFSLCFRK